MNNIEIAIVITQLTVLTLLILISVYCLISESGDKGLWVTILSGAVGVLVPAPYVVKIASL